jgi:magnesium-transporting ATPase (P-type)
MFSPFSSVGSSVSWGCSTFWMCVLFSASSSLFLLIVISAVVMGVASFAVFRLWLGTVSVAATDHDAAASTTLAAARNATLLVMVLFENVHLANCRSETRSALLLPLRRSPLLLAGTLAALAVHLVAMHWPPARALLDVAPVNGREWLLLMTVAATILPAIEIHKAWRRLSLR